MLGHSKYLSISGGTFADHSTHTTNIGTKSGFDRLEEQVAHRAFHNSGERFDAPKCHPRTRLAVLERVMEWIWGREDRDALIMWLFGPAGAGKSAIAQSIAEKCHELGLLLATFFFSKSDGSRNTAFHLIPTLAYQAALHIPETREHITATVQNDPLIFTKSLSTQVELLLIKPLRPLVDSGYFSNPNSRRLVIIDGLDECHDPKVQQQIVEQISSTLRARNVPLIFLIASRPEVHLSLTFNLPVQTQILTRLALDDHYKPEEDILVYLEDSFEQIRATHPRKGFIPDSWPSPDQVKTLVDKASGQFIYAATVVKYVESLQHSPIDRLEVILGLHPPHNDRPFAELDALYEQIFLGLDEPRPVLQILGVRNCTSFEQSYFFGSFGSWFSSVDAAAYFLFLKPSDVFGYMSNISALVTLKTDPDHEYTTIQIHHKSLIEFLEDPSRAGTFHLDPRISAAQVVHGYLQIIQDESIADDLWEHAIPTMNFIPPSLQQHCSNVCLTDALREDLMHLSVPKFIDFFLRRLFAGGLDYACEVLEALRNLSQEEIDIPDHRPSLENHLLNLLEPYFSHPRLTSLCILVADPWNMCGSRTCTPHSPILSDLLQLDESLCKMDRTRFWFTWYRLEASRSRNQPLKSIMLSAVTERKGDILATLALHLFEYVCQYSLPKDPRLHKTDYDSGMIRNAPWRWRRRVMATKPSRSKLNKDDIRGDDRRWCSDCECEHQLYMDYQPESLENLIYALDILPTLLKHAGKNDDLFTFASQHIFPQQVFCFPRPRKRAQKAIKAYLAKFPSNPPAILPPEHFGDGPSEERLEHRTGSPWGTGIFDLFANGEDADEARESGDFGGGIEDLPVDGVVSVRRERVGDASRVCDAFVSVRNSGDFEVEPVPMMEEPTINDSNKPTEYSGGNKGSVDAANSGSGVASSSNLNEVNSIAATEIGSGIPKESRRSKRKRVPRQLADALNGCLCGSVLNSSSRGVLKCYQAGCETQWFHLQCVGLEQEPRNWVCGACEASGQRRGGKRPRR